MTNDDNTHRLRTPIRALFGIAALALAAHAMGGCFIAAEAERQELAKEQKQKDQTRMSLNCQKNIQKFHDTYCDGKMKTVPVGLTDQLTRQRNGLAMNCKDPGSKAKIAELDTCLEELESNE
jgi:hypothetical protein